jgi:hypothetical protein
MKRISRSRRIVVNRSWALPLALMATLVAVGDRQAVRAQSSIIAIGPPSFQTLAGPSLEDEILYRLTFLGPREPGDLIQLARLAELRSIATLASIRTDLPGTVASVQLERDNFALWNATDAFDQAIWYLPPDVQNLAWSHLLLTDVQAAYGRLNSSLGGLPNLSPRGALYLEGISQILPFAESGLQMIEAEIVPPAPFPTARLVSLAELREQIRLLAGDLAELIRAIKGSKAGQREQETVVAGLSGLLDLAATFDRILALEPALADVLESYRLVMRGARAVEATLVRTGRAADWRPLRDRLNSMSDALQLPRAVGSLEPPRPVSPRTTALLPLIDQASGLLVAALGAPDAGDGNEPSAAKPGEQARGLQIKLLEFRQRVLTGDSIEELGGRLREITALSQQLGARARPAPAVFRGGRRQGPHNFEEVERTINRLRGLLADERKG